MSQYGDQTSAEVAEEAESERAGLISTLDQLRENLRPGNVVDEVMSHAKINSSDITDKLWRVAKANPIPATLLGLGAAMLMSAGQMKRSKADGQGWFGYDKVKSRDARRRSLYPDSKRSEAGVSGYRAATSDISNDDSAIDYELQSARQPMTHLTPFRHPRSTLSRLLEEQPLILAALGVAVGAAVGSAIPSTDVEAHWMGDASESVRQNASAMAREQLAQLKATADETVGNMKATAADHGLSADNLSGLVHDLGDHVRTAATTVASQTSDKLQ